ncbi:tenascin isoform X1 [Micropterus salmoides]|uniref:tenascin isoform X1 n=1 Tax=Micropterus salmoides TaxID=27706 RepID=UPI0018EDD650|nr:tenascin isoform X1 [Micropterus salmoides]XP_038589922.1 tenascin isoform X1 [Micropterus salmoides]
MGTRGVLVCLLLTALLSLSNAGLVKKILRHRRQTLASPEEHNMTVPSTDQPVVFNHVYNINVPASSLCSVNLDAPESMPLHPEDAAVSSGHQTTEHTVDRENQIVFTHRINIPRQACGCTDNMPGLKDLMSRLEMLEGEVSALRDQCSGEGACCSAQVTGEVGTKPYCNGHGNYSTETCGCVCQPGWKGPNCTEPVCPNNCQDRGHCVDGKCECFQGFTGEDCTIAVCPVDCGAHGQCVGGICICSDGFFGEDCSQTLCLNNCRGRGRCEDGDCVCDEPWTGFDCSELICPKDCYDRGRCENGTCYCDEGYTGEDCGDRTCPNNCHGNGFCVDGQCVCTAGYSGEDCSQLTCLNDCNGRGTCFNGMCICDTGYQGEDCSQLACLNNCNNRGQCINGQCACDVGFQGDDCAELSCPSSCLHRGRCVNGQCVCEEGFAGEDCSIRTCPSNCYGRGECIGGRCVCHAGFTGEDCGELSCPNNCQNRGQCIDGQCVCDEGFSGEDCGQKACPNDCLARGYCVDGKCICQEGFSGEDCSVLACPDNCNNRGRCINGKCICESGYEGDSCVELSCLNNCHDKGRCINGQCVCDEGYIGEDCSEVSPPKDLTVGEVTSDTVDLSWNNEMLVTEYLVTYVPTIPGGLQLEFTVPGDKTAATVRELEPGMEYQINVYAVLSNKRSVPVSARVATDLPQPEGLRFKSVRETSVEVVWDQLDIPFDGWEIYFRNTKEENGKIASTLPSSQNKFFQSGLGPGQEYEVSINIIKNNTRGPQTSEKFTTKIDGPQQVEVKDVTDSSALVGWSQPVAPIDRVTMFYGPSSGLSDETIVEISPPDKQYSIDGLRPDTEYKVSLISRSGDMSSDPVTTTFVTDLDAPTDLQAVSQTDDSITLEWTNSKADVGSYRVKYSPISGATHGEELLPRGPGDTTKATITGLKPGTEYGIGVTAVKNERESLPATTNAATDLDPPRDFKDVESTETSLTLRWQKPRAKVGAYRLVYVSRDGQVEEVEIPATATRYVLSNLTPGMSYTITLTAERGHKKSTPVILPASTASFTFYLADSDDRELTTPTASEDNVISFVYLDPSESQLSGTEPEDELGTMSVSGITFDGFDLSWTLKAHSVYDSFVVEYKDTLELWDVREVQLPGDATGSKIQDLKASTEYQIKLYGITSSQRSALLEAVAITAPKPTSSDVLSIKDTPTTPQSALDTEAVQNSDPPHPLNTEAPSSSDTGVLRSGAEPESSNLDVLGDLTVNVTSTSLSLAWSAPDQVFDSFLVELSAPSGVTQGHVTTLPGSVRKAEIEGLSPSTHYNITLQGLVEGKSSLPLKGFATTEELKPMVMNLTISDITWDGFTASWSPTGGEYDSFVIEVTNLENFAESQNLTLSGDAFSLGISGLNPNTSYMVGLFGMYQGSFLEPVYTEATTVNQPVVGKLYVSNLTSESFSIVWNGTEGEFDGFILEIIDSDWLMESKEYNISSNVTSHDVTGLRPSTDYVAYLYVTYKGSRTSAVSIVASTAEEPDLSRLVVSNITSDRFSLSWRTGEKAFDNFIVEVRESALPSQAMGRALPGDVHSTVMAGLKASTSYNIKLYASAGGQNTQPLFGVATTEDVPQLGRISASSVSPHNLSLSWSTVSGHFDGFVVRVSDPEQQSDTLEFRLPGEARNITISNLMDATGYDIELYGISHGRHTPSVLAHAVTAPLPKVENLTISNITPYGFRVSWEVKQQLQQEELAPSSGGFSHFHIVVTDSGWLLEPQEFTVPGNQTHLDMWGLITGIGYEVRLTGVSESGLLSRPLTTVAVTEAEPEVEHLFVSDITADGFRLSWTSDEDMFDRFVIKIRDGKRLAHPQEYSVRGDERTKVLTGLMSGTEYEIELYGVTLDQRSQPITGVAQTGLSTPRGLHFSEVTDSSAVVHWSMPHSHVDNYRITYVPFEGGSPMALTVDGSVFEALLPNMTPGKTYRVTVSSVKGLEESDPSTDTVTTALDRPRVLTAVNVTDSSALLVWQPSVATVDGYVITYTADSVSPVVEHVSGNTVEFEMGSLVPGTHYTVGVHATKQAQKSDSAVTEFTTDVDPPRDLTAVNIQIDSATLTWKPPQAAVTGYTLTFSSADGIIREVVLSPTASSYSMAQLSGSTEYTVRLQAIAGAQRSSHVHTVFTTIGQLYRSPKDCAQILLNGETTSGLYTMYVGGEESQPIKVYCDMTTDGGGWMVFLRRQNGKLEFYRNWKNYTAGFGNMNDEFWLGLSNLHKITNSGHYELRVDLRDNGETAYALYDRLTIAEPRTRYKIYIGAYSGTAGDSMTYHQGRPFSTYDNDNDIAVTNCALSYKGAFWYKNCHRVNLMGKYGDNSHSKGINWFHWKGHEHSIEFAEMKIRPANFRNFESRKKRS